METADEIWEGDLFGRRAEAEDLVGYLESVAARQPLREDGHAHVLAVDGRYGEGKTYFLRRFARHMRMTHPVAFVDAWVDDLEDEPLVALAATLSQALEPYTKTDATMRDRLREFQEKAGRVSKIVGVGLLKRGVGLVITQGAAEVLSAELVAGSEAQKDISKDALKSAGQGAVDEATEAIIETTTPSMDERIARFREGQEAIRAMKAGLSAVVERLNEQRIPTPITIIIDELDRCRPTYAIKLLEEVKHLFDVSGVAFVLGLHAGQLAHSVSAAYGAGFDSQSYLRRFFSRRYTLRPADLDALIQVLIENLSIPLNRVQYPHVRFRGSGRPQVLPLHTLIADTMRAYNLTARDSFELMERLQTALALTAPNSIQLSYFLPLLIAYIKGEHQPQPMDQEPSWNFVFFADSFGRDPTDTRLDTIAKEIHDATQLSLQGIHEMYNKDQGGFAVRMVAENSFDNSDTNSYHRFANYKALIMAIKRFS
jgi:AraC-like DNA-binding protein